MEPATKLAAELIGLRDPEEYLQAAGELLLKLFPCENVVYNVLDVRAPTADVHVLPAYPFPTHAADILPEIWNDHPLVLSYQHDTGDGIWTPRRLSDLVTDTQLYRSRAYHETLAPLGSNRELAFLVTQPTPFTLTGWAINRVHQDFTDFEVHLVGYIQPVLRLLEASHHEKHPDIRWATAAHVHGLSAREQEILRLVGQGLTATAISHLLGISPRTVAKHLEHSYTKLGCTNRVDALRRLRGE